MKKIDLAGLDEVIFYEKLDNGLEVYLLPYENKENYIMSYITKFGSLKTTFKPIGEKEMITVPDGIAHFLEHKMFEQEDGIDPFTFTAKTGTYSNAATNYDSTAYYFEGNKAFSDNLNYLLDFVGSPYFTDENVEKEKGIIAEEIKQYDDEIDWFFDEEMKKAMLKKDNHRIDIAGTVESINKITKEDLYKTYNTFYQPSNMFIVICGSFDKDEAINIIKNNKTLNKYSKQEEIEIEKIVEDKEINEQIVNTKFNISNTRVGLGLKIPVGNSDRFLLNCYIALMLNIKFGLSSLFREKIKKDNLMTSFYVERELIDDYILVYFKAESDKPDELVNEIKKELNNIELTTQEIDRMKKVWISSTVMMLDDINLTSESIIDDIIMYGKFIPDKIDAYRKLNKDDYMKIVSNIDFNNTSIVTVTPFDNKSS